MKQLIRVAVLVSLLLLVIAMPAAAHEGREVGEYLMSFGWRVEPAYAGQMNGPEIFIELHAHDEGEAHAEGTEEAHSHEGEDHAHEELTVLEVSLQAEVTFGPETTTITFRPAYGEEGHYVAELIPTLPGDYSFRIFGTIGETAVDEVFNSADGEFSSVEPVGDIMFPAVVPAGDVETRIADLEARIAALEAQLAEGE